MVFSDEFENLTIESEIYKHVVKIRDSLERTIEVQYAKKSTLTQVLDEIANIEEIKLEDTQGLLLVIEDIRNILSRIDDNIEGVKALIDDVTGIQDRLDNIIEYKMEDDLLNKDMEYFYILYIEKANIIEDTDLKYEEIILKSYKFVFLLVSKLNEERKSKDIIEELVEFNKPQEQDNTGAFKNAESNIEDINNYGKALEKNDKEDKVIQEQKIEDIAQEKMTINVQEEKEEKKDIINNQEKYMPINKTSKGKIAKTEIATEIENSYRKEKEIKVKDNNVLIISQIQNKVFLPYKVEELRRKYNEESGKFSSIHDLITTEYVVSLDKYKNPVVARFKEAYNLMRKKESATFSDALDLALEVAFKSNLNPAVITACNDLNQLDKYLDCLEENTLDKFNGFKIEYEALPNIK